MRLLAAGAALALIGVTAPSAQTAGQAAQPARPAVPPAQAAAPAFGPPRGLPGYAQPEVGGAMCRNINPSQSVCTVPAMTAGRYRVRASGTSTSQGADAIQALSIQVGSRNCGRIDNKKPWPNGARTVRLDCEIVVMTDRPLAVTAIYADAKAVKDPRGPGLVLDRLPWEGVLSAQVSAPKQ